MRNFSSRGKSAALAALSLTCAPSDKSAASLPSATCSKGDTLLFDLNQAGGYRYFLAFARREDGTVIWYFPQSSDGFSLDLEQQLTQGVLDRGAILGEHHLPGRYQVYGVFSNEPFTRQSFRSQFDENAKNFNLGESAAVVVREMTVR